MDRSTKLLVLLSFLIIFLGFGFLWFGGNSPLPEQTIISPSPIPITDFKEATGSAVVGVQGERAIVSKVVDGDTIDLEDGRTVRFIGMDTPETLDPRRPVGCFGKEASNETKSLLTNKVVILQKDVSDNDKFGRILRYIYLPLENGQTLFVNDYLVREGYAKVYTYPPDVKFDKQFRQAEIEAREGRRGLWQACQ